MSVVALAEGEGYEFILPKVRSGYIAVSAERGQLS